MEWLYIHFYLYFNECELKDSVGGFTHCSKNTQKEKRKFPSLKCQFLQTKFLVTTRVIRQKKIIQRNRWKEVYFNSSKSKDLSSKKTLFSRIFPKDNVSYPSIPSVQFWKPTAVLSMKKNDLSINLKYLKRGLARLNQ